MLLRRMKSKIRRARQHRPVKKEVPHDYMHFKGSEEYFIRNGAWLLEESRSTFLGRWNPIRHFSVGDLNNMNVERVAYRRDGFYDVYRGSWEGSVVLVKRASKGDDDRVNARFLREIVIAAELATHNNVHKLLGCCFETEFPILVYDGIAVTLKDCIGADEKDQNMQVRVLEWKDRLRIAWEISHVTAYLHTAFPRPIIHRELKPSNVFLDHDNSAKLSDFSLSISIPEGEEVVETDSLIGTYGYIAPEYLQYSIVSESTDVYSFGKLFLEILTGKKVGVLPKSSTKWAQNGLRDKNIKKILDPVITRKVTTSVADAQLIASIILALRCISYEKDDRPTMMEVATQLKSLMVAPEIPDSIPPEVNKEGLTYKIYRGSEENFESYKALLVEESISLLDGGLNIINYFSVYDLNNMKVEHGLVLWDDDWLCYQGSWEGKAVLVKHPRGALDLTVSKKIQLRLLREILIATEMANCNNVQKLLGCCLETKFPILVYEWVAPEALTNRIIFRDEEKDKLPILEWNDRLRIAWEISVVVSDLHKWFPRPIIYNLLEPMYVFLDEYNTAKLSNFSRSVSIPEGEEFMVLEDFEILYTKDHYTPPEYYKHRKVGKCTDVYSFGILFLALLTGRSLNKVVEEEEEDDDDNMVECARNAMIDNCVIEILDPAITKNGLTVVEELKLKASVQLAIRCVEEDHGNRPKMAEVANELNNIIK